VGQAGTSVLFRATRICALMRDFKFQYIVLQLAKISGFSPIITTASLTNEISLQQLGATHVLSRDLSTPFLDSNIILIKLAASRSISGRPNWGSDYHLRQLILYIYVESTGSCKNGVCGLLKSVSRVSSSAAVVKASSSKPSFPLSVPLLRVLLGLGLRVDYFVGI